MIPPPPSLKSSTITLSALDQNHAPPAMEQLIGDVSHTQIHNWMEPSLGFASLETVVALQPVFEDSSVLAIKKVSRAHIGDA
ncbi:unnamed protein product [Cuscuta campestris]|uniref:Uncharacterized protein n=1 Tax=Cuscuta campestris TaxID=132261 RepID=A0A484LMQ2_9ASTE|nr:unnamed protein product [Cuscuta campestris]